MHLPNLLQSIIALIAAVENLEIHLADIVLRQHVESPAFCPHTDLAITDGYLFNSPMLLVSILRLHACKDVLMQSLFALISVAQACAALDGSNPLKCKEKQGRRQDTQTRN